MFYVIYFPFIGEINFVLFVLFVVACCYKSEQLQYSEQFITVRVRAFFLGGRRGTRTPKHFVNLTGESKNFKCWNSR